MPLTRNPARQSSPPEVHRSVKIPNIKSFWRKMLVYAGSQYLIAVRYMDSGNWAKDIPGGSKFNYTFTTIVRYFPETSCKIGGFQA